MWPSGSGTRSSSSTCVEEADGGKKTMRYSPGPGSDPSERSAMRPSCVGLLERRSVPAPAETDLDSGARLALLRVEDVCRDHAANLRACTRWSRAISVSSAWTSAPPRTTSSPPTTSRSTRCGAERTRPATGSSAPPSSRPSVRQTAKIGALARLERADVVATRARRAPPRVPSRRASRAVIAAGPPRPRATRSACFTSKRRSLRSFDAEPSTPSPTRTPASRYSRTGATPAPSRRFDVGQCATPGVGCGEVGDVVRARGGRSARTRRPGRASRDRSGTPRACSRRARGSTPPPPRVSARCVCSGRPKPPGEVRGLGHQALRDRERRAGRDGDLDACVRACLVQLADEALCIREDRVDVLDELVGREAAVGDAEVHRAPRRHDPDAELTGSLDFRLDEARASAREDVVVVEDRRAARPAPARPARSARRRTRLRRRFPPTRGRAPAAR